MLTKKYRQHRPMFLKFEFRTEMRCSLLARTGNGGKHAATTYRESVGHVTAAASSLMGSARLAWQVDAESPGPVRIDGSLARCREAAPRGVYNAGHVSWLSSLRKRGRGYGAER